MRILRRILPAIVVVAAFAVGIVAAPAASAALPPDLIISEYVEGVGNDKAIELYNGTGAAVDLSSYTVELYSNVNDGSAPSASVTLSGTLADGGTYVIAHASSSAAIQAIAASSGMLNSAVANFNGDDRLILRKGAAVTDSFGQVGVRPASTIWANVSYVRNANVCVGDTDPTNAFDVATEWTSSASGDISHLGSHSTTCSGAADPAPTVTATTPTDGATAVNAAANLTVTFSEDVTLAPNALTLSCNATAVPGSIAGGPTSFTFDPTADLPENASCVLTVAAASVTDQDGIADPMAANYTVDFVVDGPVVVLPIGTVQGSGAASPLVGDTVTVRGVVVGDHEGPAASKPHGGFYVQSLDAETDGNPATSEGIFVFTGSDTNLVSLGDVIEVTGKVSEFSGLTEITPDNVDVTGTGSATPAAVSLPLTSSGDLERYEGMLVKFGATLYVTDTFGLGRYGEVSLSGGTRLPQPTAIVEPGAPASAQQAANDLNRILLDDLTSQQNPDPIIWGEGGNPLSASNTLRGGDTITGLTGVLTFGFGEWVIRPQDAAHIPVFTASNPRPATAPDVGGTVKVASMNVLNYFTTTDEAGHQCGPTGNTADCRGANSAAELKRQQDKLVQALLSLNADVFGLMEVENTTGVEPLATLTTALNAAQSERVYSYVDTGTIGTDVIRVGMIYDTKTVTLNGAYAVLDSSVDPRFVDTNNRPSLAQSFTDIASGETFTVVANHLKSKGSCPSSGVDSDKGDGASCWNDTRTKAATALVDWIASDPTHVGDPDVFVMGDFNSYAKEDPIDVLVNAGFTELGGDYSYTFDGQWGSLDYVFASSSLASQISGASHFHINSDEPTVLDYNTEFKSPAQLSSLYGVDEFRTSDHDPVLVGLDFATTPETPAVEPSPKPVAGPTDGTKLAATGSDADEALGWAAVLLLLGVVVTVMGARRRRGSTH